MREKMRQKRSDWSYEKQIENYLCAMFDYDERIYRPELIDFILHYGGQCALIKTDTSDFTPVVLQFVGGFRYADGTFSNALCLDEIGNQYIFEDWLHNPDICVIFNNFLRNPDIWIEKYAYMLTEIDTSLDCNIYFSRMKRVPIAEDQTTKSQIDAVLDDLTAGKTKTILKKPSMKSITGEDSGIEVLDLTDVTKSQYIQYLSHLYDSIKSRVYEMIGIGYADCAKQAQISISELQRNQNAEFLNPTIWYKCRKKAFDDYAKKSGVQLQFDYSDIWKTEINNMEGKSNEVDRADADTSIL